VILDDIVADVRATLVERKACCPEAVLQEEMEKLPPPLDVAGILARPGVSIVAEVKRASPSRGTLKQDLLPEQMALAYAEAGAAAISVLTEPLHFQGSPEDLIGARRALADAQISCPLLRKDFVVDSYQLLEARAWGADAVLLIAAILDDADLARLMARSGVLGLTPLVEVHDSRELERVLRLSPSLIGINNRNLADFSVDLAVTRQLRPLIPPECVVVSESGIHEPAQIRDLAALQVDAALIGEALVTAPDPARKLRTLREAGQ
jgi:indole-3-glycerol phosphate synthase